MALRDVSVSTGIRYTDEQKELAYRTWTLEANRNASKTARLLAELEDDGFSVDRRSIAEWAKQFNWEDRANRELYAASPVLRFRTQTVLSLAAPAAADLIHRLIAGDESLMSSKNVYSSDGELLGVEKFFDEKILKVRLNAAQLALDRAGFSPVGTRDIGGIDAPPELNAAWQTMLSADASEEELRAASEKIRASSGIGQKPGVTAKRVNTTGRGIAG